MLRHFPSRYERGGVSVRVASLAPGTKVTLFGKVSGLKAKKLWKSRRNATEGWFEDASGRVKLLWFNQPYIASYITEGSTVKLSGTVGGTNERPYIANPQVEQIPPGAIEEGLFSSDAPRNDSIFPVYPESRGITSLWFYHAIEKIFETKVHTRIEDPIPQSVRKHYHLPDITTALVAIHKPVKDSHAEASRKRFSFEEIFAIQVARAKERAENDSEKSFEIAGEQLAQQFISSLEVIPTGAQKKAVAEILKDFQKNHPMARLLEGDVGSGKTLVAAATAYAVVNSRPPARRSGTLQVAYMAPTEILAGQHFQSFISNFHHLPINIALITGSGCKKFPSKVARGEATDISR